jgi:hypothetical protein
MASETVSDLVALALRTVSRPYPPDVTDRVCQAIESDPTWLDMYNDMVADMGRHAVNSTIGRTVLTMTGLRNSGIRHEARSSLINSYTVLVG